MKIYTILPFLAFFVFQTVTGQLKCHKTFSPEQLQEDFLILTTSLREVHPDLYRVNSKIIIEARIKEIQNSITTDKTYLEFLKCIATLFTDIGDINTQWGHSPDYIKFRNDSVRIFPSKFFLSDEKFYLAIALALDSNYYEHVEVVKIEGETIKEYLEKNYTLLPTDGKIRTIQKKWLEAYFPQHHSNFWEQPDTFHLEIKNDGSDYVYLYDVPARLKKEIAWTDPVSYYKKPSSEFFIKDNVAVLSIPSFDEKELKQWESFLDSCFTVIQNQKTSNVVLNLKGQGKGNMYLGALLYSYFANVPFKYIAAIKTNKNSAFTFEEYLANSSNPDEGLIELRKEMQPKKNTFKGNLFILTDGWTMSAKGFFCAKIETRENTFFAGEECGATTFGMNDYPISVKLPNTGIVIHIPTTQMIANKKNYHSLYGPMVDYKLPEAGDYNMIYRLIDTIEKGGK